MTFSILLYSNYKTSLLIYFRYLTNLLNKLNVYHGYFFFPKKKKIITILKSPHVFKKSKDQFMIIQYKINIQINQPLDTNLIYTIIKNKPKTIKIHIKINK